MKRKYRIEEKLQHYKKVGDRAYRDKVKALQEVLGLHHTAIYRWKNLPAGSKSAMSTDQLVAIAGVLGCEPQELLN